MKLLTVGLLLAFTGAAFSDSEYIHQMTQLYGTATFSDRNIYRILRESMKMT